jgi:hypothetical protein
MAKNPPLLVSLTAFASLLPLTPLRAQPQNATPKSAVAIQADEAAQKELLKRWQEMLSSWTPHEAKGTEAELWQKEIDTVYKLLSEKMLDAKAPPKPFIIDYDALGTIIPTYEKKGTLPPYEKDKTLSDESNKNIEDFVYSLGFYATQHDFLPMVSPKGNASAFVVSDDALKAFSKNPDFLRFQIAQQMAILFLDANPELAQKYDPSCDKPGDSANIKKERAELRAAITEDQKYKNWGNDKDLTEVQKQDIIKDNDRVYHLALAANAIAESATKILRFELSDEPRVSLKELQAAVKKEGDKQEKEKGRTLTGTEEHKVWEKTRKDLISAKQSQSDSDPWGNEKRFPSDRICSQATKLIAHENGLQLPLSNQTAFAEMTSIASQMSAFNATREKILNSKPLPSSKDAQEYLVKTWIPGDPTPEQAKIISPLIDELFAGLHKALPNKKLPPMPAIYVAQGFIGLEIDLMYSQQLDDKQPNYSIYGNACLLNINFGIIRDTTPKELKAALALKVAELSLAYNSGIAKDFVIPDMANVTKELAEKDIKPGTTMWNTAIQKYKEAFWIDKTALQIAPDCLDAFYSLNKKIEEQTHRKGAYYVTPIPAPGDFEEHPYINPSYNIRREILALEQKPVLVPSHIDKLHKKAPTQNSAPHR